MNAMKIGLLFLVLNWTLPLLAEDDVLSRIPKDTVLIGRIDLEQLRESRLGMELLAQHGSRVESFQSFMVDMVGLDPDAVRRVWFLSSEKDRGIAILEGSFSATQLSNGLGRLPTVQKVEQAETLFAVHYNDAKKPRKQAAMLLDQQTLVVGDRELVERYLAALGDRQLLFSSDHPQLTQLADSSATVIGTVLGEITRWPDFGKDAGYGVEEVWLTAEVGDEVTATLEVLAMNEVQAEALVNLAKGLCHYKATDPMLAAKPLIQNALRHATADSAERTATLTVKLNGAEIVRHLAAGDQANR